MKQQQQQKLESITSDRGADVWYPQMCKEVCYSVSTHHIDPDSILVADLNPHETAAKIERITSYEDLMENCADKADAAIKPALEGVCKKRKRTAKKKNKEEVECQRMVHIAVERNRRKQMNEHLDVLRSLMPASYIQRGDQASIVGGTIEFVKELELALHSLIARRKNLAFQYSPTPSYDSSSSSTSSDTLSLPRKKKSTNNNITTDSSSLQEQWRQLEKKSNKNNNNKGEGEGSRTLSPNVDVEKVGANAFRVRVLLSSGATGHGHLFRLVTLLQQSLKLLIRHLYVTTMGHTVFYSFDVHKQGQICVGDAARVSVEEIAFSIQQIL